MDYFVLKEETPLKLDFLACTFSDSCLAFSADPAVFSWTGTGREELSSKAMQAVSISTCCLPLPELCRLPAEM